MSFSVTWTSVSDTPTNVPEVLENAFVKLGETLGETYKLLNSLRTLASGLGKTIDKLRFAIQLLSAGETMLPNELVVWNEFLKMYGLDQCWAGIMDQPA